MDMGAMPGWMIGSPRREQGALVLVGVLLVADFVVPALRPALFVAAAIGSLPLLIRGLHDLVSRHFHITIDVFNLFAIGVSFATGDARSAAFIVLMITSADLLDWRMTRRTEHAVQRLLALKPTTAVREHGTRIEEDVPLTQIKSGDILIVRPGGSVPADGVVISGDAFVNEALVTGESVPVQKVPGSRVLVSTIIESGVIKIRATQVGADSTIERMAQLIREAAAHKSEPERLADRFASIFLPFIVAFGAVVYVVTRDIRVTAALFLVACADDMALAIPLAMTGAFGQAARRGVVIKGGVVLDTLAKAKTFVLDKTGTLTYGSFRINEVHIEPGIDENHFWRLIGVSNKFSEHPIGRALVQEAYRHVKEIPDPDEVKPYKGMGVVAKLGADTVANGNPALFKELHVAVPLTITEGVLVSINGVFAGAITVADIPRKEAAASIRQLEKIGIRDIRMFTGDSQSAADRVAQTLVITQVTASMKPEDKLRALKEIPTRPVVMVGDGINDAPALAQADVGIAMGGSGTAIAAEAADMVVLTDNIARLPEMVLLARATMRVIQQDIALWLITNAAGFALVLAAGVSPAFAAFYNFATDFIPLMNSARLFRSRIR